MTDERRYQDAEITEIFRAAAAADDSPSGTPPSAGGLTLAELQAIGRDVGVAPERIAAAASALDRRRGALPRQTDLGMPIAVGRTVELPRALTDREWDVLVGELRRTFGAQGTLRSGGNLREWRNGNLHASLEPTEDGYALRLGTLKGDAMAINRGGMFGILLALVMLVAFLATGALAVDLQGPAVLAALGAAALGYNAVRLPGWAREREAQMEYIAGRVRDLVGGLPEGGGDAAY